MVRDIFVSYSQPDHGCAMELVDRVEQEGINCWIAPRDIAPSADWAAEIIDAIANSRTMILLFSAHSNESPQVRREVERAVHKQVSILPFRIENVLPTKSLEYFLSAQHWLDAFPPPLAPHYERLCQQVKNILRASMPAAAAAPHAFGREELDVLQGKLAQHIGPLAGYLVKRAAASAVDWKQLIDSL